MYKEYADNCSRLAELANVMERENRDLTQEEKDERTAIERRQAIIEMKHKAIEMTQNGKKVRDLDKVVVDAAERRERSLVFRLVREGEGASSDPVDEATFSSAMDGTGIIPVKQMEMLKPIRTGLIYDKVGLRVVTGNVGTILRWPSHSKLKATWRGEGERVLTQKIDFSKLEVVPKGLSVAAAATREALLSSSGVVEGIIREEMPAGVVDSINEAMFTTDSSKLVTGVANPWTSATSESLSSTPARADLLKAKAAVVKEIGTLKAPCWVMTETTKAILEDVKVDAGSGRFLIENGFCLGMPVFTTEFIGEGKIGFGDFSYLAAGFFGGFDVTVDPYTLLQEGETNFVLHTQFAAGLLNQKAFYKISFTA